MTTRSGPADLRAYGGPADLPTLPGVPIAGDPGALPEPATACPYVAAHVRPVMGMPVSIQLRGPDPRGRAAAAAVDAAYDYLTWVDATFSRWRPDSELSRLRRGELTLAECGPQMQEVHDLCEHWRVCTQGWFTHRLPDEGTGQWLFDPTGLVKGWAIARAAVILAAVPAHAYCVNAGGDLAVGGTDEAPGGDRPWRLGIEDPYRPGTVARVVELREGGLATSGCAARGAHLVDPASGKRLLRPGSVSVIAPDIVSADVWATALFVGPKALADLVANRPGWDVVRL